MAALRVIDIHDTPCGEEDPCNQKIIKYNQDMKLGQQGAIDMVLTSIVNNEPIFNEIVLDIENRFKTKVDKDKLFAFLNVVDVKVSNEPILV